MVPPKLMLAVDTLVILSPLISAPERDAKRADPWPEGLLKLKLSKVYWLPSNIPVKTVEPVPKRQLVAEQDPIWNSELGSA